MKQSRFKQNQFHILFDFSIGERICSILCFLLFIGFDPAGMSVLRRVMKLTLKKVLWDTQVQLFFSYFFFRMQIQWANVVVKDKNRDGIVVSFKRNHYNHSLIIIKYRVFIVLMSM